MKDYSKNITRRIKQKIEKEIESFKILTVLKQEIPTRFLKYVATLKRGFISKREVILSEWLEGNNQ